MSINRFSGWYATALLFFLLVTVAACGRKTVAATATVPARPEAPAYNSETGPDQAMVRPEMPEPDPEVSGKGSAKMRQLAAKNEKSGPTAVFTLRKTPCYGDCPVFRLVVLSDGTVQYSGIRNVELLGEYQSQLTPGWVDRLQRKVITQGIFSWSDTYPEDTKMFIADASNTITTFVWNGREKTITNNYDAPPALVELEKELTELVGELKWSLRQD